MGNKFMKIQKYNYLSILASIDARPVMLSKVSKAAPLIDDIYKLNQQSIQLRNANADRSTQRKLQRRLQRCKVSLKKLINWLPSTTYKIYSLRHDVDYSLDQALALAMFEQQHNVQSTYFLLPTAKYFDYSETFNDKCQQLISLGHEIGLHNDALTQWVKSGGEFNNQLGLLRPSIKDIVLKPLTFFRDNDIEVVGTSCHGHISHYKKGYFNYEIWEEFDAKRNESLNHNKWLDTISLKDVGLDYETYFLDYDAYLSDSGAHWIGMITNPTSVKPFESTALRSPFNIGLDVIQEFNNMTTGFLQVLFHPCWWGEVLV